jgi:hypothetical protein
MWNLDYIKENSRIPIDYRILLLFLLFVLLSGYSVIFYGIYSTIAGIITKVGLVDLGGNPAGHDFVVFWAASEIVKNGDPSIIYSLMQFNASLQSIIGTNIADWAWNYPPTFLLIVLPFSYLPYLQMLVLWIIGTLILFLGMMRLIVPHPIAPLLFLGFPSVVYNFCAGQNGFFSTLFLGGGLLLLDRSPFIAGLLLGMLSYKPQLFILLPIALLAGRYWKALFGLAVGVSGLALLSLIIIGSNAWQAFFANIYFTATHWQTEDLLLKMPTIFALARLLGISSSFAVVFQLVLTSILVIILIWSWSKKITLALRGSIICLCIALSSPYLFSYDLVVISLPFAWLGWIAYEHSEKNMLMMLILIWIFSYFTIFHPIGVNLTPIPLAILLIITTLRIRSSEKVNC